MLLKIHLSLFKTNLSSNLAPHRRISAQVEGSDLRKLTMDLKQICRGSIGGDTMTISATSNGGTTTTIDDWTLPDAQDFLQTVASIPCKVLIIFYNIRGFPLPLLQTCLEQHADELDYKVVFNVFDTNNNSSTTTPSQHQQEPHDEDSVAHHRPYFGKVQMNFGSFVDWTIFSSWLQKTSLCHPDSYLKQVYVSIWSTCFTMEEESYKSFWKIILWSVRTRCLEVNAQSHCSTLTLQAIIASFQKDDSRVVVVAPAETTTTTQLKFRNVQLLSTNNSKRLWISLCETNNQTPDSWMALSAWLETLKDCHYETVIFKMSCPLKVTHRTSFYQFLKTFSTTTTRHAFVLDLYLRKLPSNLISNIVTKVVQEEGISLHTLKVATVNDHWMKDPTVQDALRDNQTIQTLNINTGQLIQQFLLEEMLRTNYSITTCHIRGANKVTPTTRMYLRLNNNGKRRLLYSQQQQVITPTQWVNFLILTNQDHLSSTNDRSDDNDCLINLSCIFFFLRNYPSFYVSLALG